MLNENLLRVTLKKPMTVPGSDKALYVTQAWEDRAGVRQMPGNRIGLLHTYALVILIDSDDLLLCSRGDAARLCVEAFRVWYRVVSG
jgi:hypothetical protein